MRQGHDAEAGESVSRRDRGREAMATTMKQAAAERPVDMGLERLLFFSDAVFAIAITLLILDIKVPDAVRGHAALMGAIFDLWPKFLSYLLSFLVIGVYWAIHHRLFRYIRGHDGRLVWLNILFLLSIAFLPFPTSLLSSYPGEQVSVVFYSGALTVTGLLLNAIWQHASRSRHLIDPDLDPDLIRNLHFRFLAAPLIFLVAALAALFNAALGESLWVLVIVVEVLLSHQYHHHHPAITPGPMMPVGEAAHGQHGGETPSTAATARPFDA